MNFSDLDSSMEAQKHHIEQLEEQLKVLSKIGGQLQRENKGNGHQLELSLPVAIPYLTRIFRDYG